MQPAGCAAFSQGGLKGRQTLTGFSLQSSLSISGAIHPSVPGTPDRLLKLCLPTASFLHRPKSEIIALTFPWALGIEMRMLWGFRSLCTVTDTCWCTPGNPTQFVNLHCTFFTRLNHCLFHQTTVNGTFFNSITSHCSADTLCMSSLQKHAVLWTKGNGCPKCSRILKAEHRISLVLGQTVLRAASTRGSQSLHRSAPDQFLLHS